VKLSVTAKIIVLFVLAGVIPLIAIGVLSYINSSKALERQAFNQLASVREIKKGQIERFFAERQGDMGVLADTVSTLRKEAFDKLEAVREVKRDAIKRYFKTINDQILSFSENGMIVNAMSQFSGAFRNVCSKNNLTDADMKRMKGELRTYYTGEFTTKRKMTVNLRVRKICLVNWMKNL